MTLLQFYQQHKLHFRYLSKLYFLRQFLKSLFQFLPSIDADLVSFDSESKLPYKPNRRMYNVLIEKGYHFEILYTPAIQDSTRRKNTIHISHLYHAFGKSKNIIISSGAENHLQIRGPYDIINLYPSIA